MIKPIWPKIKSLGKIKKILLTAFLLISIFIAFLSSLMATEFGSHWVVRKAADYAHIKLGNLQGNLLTGLDIESLDLHQNDLQLHAEKISFRWQPIGLFYAEVNVESLSAEKIRLHLPPSKNEPEPENYQWPSLAQPVRIKLAKINLHDIQIQQGETLIPINRISGSLGLGTFNLRASDLIIANDQAQLQANGAVGLRYPYSMDVNLAWQLNDKSAAEKISGKVVVGGDIKTIKLQQDLMQPLSMKLTANISPALHLPKEKPTADIKLEWAEQNMPDGWAKYVNFRISQLPQEDLAKITKGTTKGHIHLAGWLDTFKLQTQIQASSDFNRFVVNGIAQGGYDLQQNTLQTQIEKLTLLAKPVDAEQSSNTVSISGNLKSNDLKASVWDWSLNVKTEHLNINQFIENWPSDLNAEVDIQGDFNPQKKSDIASGLTLAVNNVKVQGDLRGLAVSGHGELDFDGAHWSSSDANLAIGANQLSLKGQASDKLAVDWKVNAPLLGQIDPSLGGSIISSGLISGDKANPRIQINAQVNQFVWRDYSIENLSLKLNPKAEAQEYDLLLDASHLQWQSQRISHFIVKGAGTLAQHTIDAQLESPNIGNAHFKLSSSWQDEIWHGQWRELVFTIKKMPIWSLTSATPMEVNTKENKQTANLGKLCLTTDHSQATNQQTPLFCVSTQWGSATGLQVESNLTAIPVNQLQAWLPEAVLSGFIEGNAKLQIPLNKPVILDSHFNTRDVQLVYQFQGGKVETYPLQKATLDATIKNDQLNVSALMEWAAYGNLSADTKYIFKDKKIQGKFIAALKDLAPLESLLPFLNDVQGSASANVNIAGTADKPEIYGNISLNKTSANLPRLGLILRDASLQINSQRSGQVHVEGQITSGDGTLMLRGDLENVGTPEWSWQSNIYGADIRFIEQPQMTATISPNLKLSANATAINLTGSTEIPSARAALKTLPSSATRVSSDVVVIENERSQNSNGVKKSIPFYTDIILYFGDDVRFKGFGLDTQLLGKVNVLKEENRQTFVTGFVAVGKGNYKAYGQDLVIERGRLIFQGPYDNPGLDIRATRALDSGVAGLEIGGTLQHPKSSVFAIPAASDSEAMAMLLTGKTLSQSSQADAYSLIGAISTLGMDNGEGMTSDIAHFFHIDEIAVKADKGLDQSELLMGKYVTPKLFIRYIVGLFDQTFSLGVRYQLNEKLRIEAESGKNQSVDIIYKIER